MTVQNNELDRKFSKRNWQEKNKAKTSTPTLDYKMSIKKFEFENFFLVLFFIARSSSSKSEEKTIFASPGETVILRNMKLPSNASSNQTSIQWFFRHYQLGADKSTVLIKLNQTKTDNGYDAVISKNRKERVTVINGVLVIKNVAAHDQGRYTSRASFVSAPDSKHMEHNTTYILRIKEMIECDLGRHVCREHAECMKTNGRLLCVCKRGFTGDGKVCSEILNSKDAIMVENATKTVNRVGRIVEEESNNETPFLLVNLRIIVPFIGLTVLIAYLEISLARRRRRVWSKTSEENEEKIKIKIKKPKESEQEMLHYTSG